MVVARQSLLKTLFVSICAYLVAFSVFAQSPIAAFSYSSQTETALSSARSSTVAQQVQSWPIEINDQLRELTAGDTFSLPLPTGELVAAQITSRLDFTNQDIQLIAGVTGGGRVILTLGRQTTFGSINTDSMSFSIGQTSQQTSLVDNQTIRFEPELGDDIMIPPMPFQARSASYLSDLAILSAQSTSESTIDILVVYSTEFADLFETPETRINQLISFTNTSFADSGVLINLRLVAAVELPFNNSNSVSTNLTNATDALGDFTTLPELRNQYGADLVAVLNANTNNQFSANGIAWLNGDNPNFAFSATRLSEFCCDSVFAHEIGHNLGSGHEYSSVNPELSPDNECDTTFTFTNYSCGYGNYINAGNNNNWGTIMSNFSNKANVGYLFSNTDNDCLGLPCGVAQGNFEAADNRTSFNMSRLLVAEFRDEIIPSNPSTPTNTDNGWLPAILFNLLGDETD